MRNAYNQQSEYKVNTVDNSEDEQPEPEEKVNLKSVLAEIEE